jgi:hypothetical protein
VHLLKGRAYSSGSDVPYHHPAEIQLIIAKINDVVVREKAYPIKLHASRVASDTALLDFVSTFRDLVGMLESDITDLQKSDNVAAVAMREIVDVLKDNFSQLHTHVLQREATTAKDFEDYSELNRIFRTGVYCGLLTTSYYRKDSY